MSLKLQKVRNEKKKTKKKSPYSENKNFTEENKFCDLNEKIVYTWSV